MHDADRRATALKGQLLLVDEAGSMIEQTFNFDPAFHADNAAWLARELPRWAKDLRRMSAEREAGMSLFGAAGDHMPLLVGPLRAQILISDENGDPVEWRFETSPEHVEELADWLVAVGRWNRRPSAGKEPPAGLVGRDSEPTVTTSKEAT